MFTQVFEFDVEFLKYLKTRYFKWTTKLTSSNSEQLVELDFFNGQNGRELIYVPVIFRYSNIFEKQLTVENVLKTNPNLTYPFILVTPLDEEDLREQMPYVDIESVLDHNTDTAKQYQAAQRVAFQYQIEGISDNWIDHRIMKDLLYYKLAEDQYNQKYINLFGYDHTLKAEPITQSVEEDSNKFRAIQTIKIETSIYTTKSVDYLRVLNFIVNNNVIVEGN